MHLEHNTPYVQEPDDGDNFPIYTFLTLAEETTEEQPQRQQAPQRSHARSSQLASRTHFPGTMHSFSQTTVYHGRGGPDGYNYRSTTTTTRSGDVQETHHSEHDSRAGIEKLAVHRSLGDRARTIYRERDGSGQQRVDEHLHGISQGTVLRNFVFVCALAHGL